MNKKSTKESCAKWLIFDNHDWSKWKKIGEGTAEYAFLGGGCLIYLQERICGKCGKIERELQKIG